MSSSRLIALPPQHGAWAFLVVPLVIGIVQAGPAWAVLAFAVAWIAAYPASYFVIQAAAARVRRGQWTARAVRERRQAVPWLVIAGLPALVLVALRPVLLIAGLGFVVLLGLSLWLTIRGRERGFSNDLVLVAMAATGVPLLWVVSRPGEPIPAESWWTAAFLLTYFIGSVIHVKSLIREARDVRWRRGSIAWHVGMLGWLVASPFLAIAVVPALVRSIAIRPGTRPVRVGAIEIAIAVLVVVAVLLAF